MPYCVCVNACHTVCGVCVCSVACVARVVVTLHR